MKLVVACVWTGDKYTVDYVHKLAHGVARNLNEPYEFVCITDGNVQEVKTIGAHGLAGWWAKMVLFEPSWRRNANVIYLDLDTVVVGDLSPLAAISRSFAFTTCFNFARAAGVSEAKWPCKFNSSVITIGGGFPGDVWWDFIADKQAIMERNVRFGDQHAIEELLGYMPPMLQDLLPVGYLLNYRRLTEQRPIGAAIVNFGGKSKPHNCQVAWVKEQWEL